MMHLSRLHLNFGSRAVRRDLADCQELHRTVMLAFPEVEGRDAARDLLEVLYRTELGESPVLLVQSTVVPAWDRVLARHGADYVVRAPEVKAVEEFFGALAPGARLRFRLRANATKKIGTSTVADRQAGRKCNGKRIPVPEGERDAWLARKGEAAGFRVIEVQNGRDPSAAGGLAKGQRGGSTLTFATVLFEGVLDVTDADAFRKALREGIGPGKAYGFGLLSVAPAGTMS